MRRKSSSTAGATYLSRLDRIEELRLAAGRAAARMPSIHRVVLFGSLVTGIPTPRSDADLIVIVTDSPHDEPRDRLPEVLRAMAPLPCPLDLVVLTDAEMARRQEDPNMLAVALSHGVDLIPDPARLQAEGSARGQPGTAE